MPPEPRQPDDAARFAPGLLDPAAPAPAHLAGRDGAPAGRRYDVYRNNVTMGLLKALESTFPATRRLAGEDGFRAAALSYLRRTPPVSPLLLDYGREFPAWIDAVAPASHVGWLADVARLERAWLDAWHAADGAPLDPAALASIAPEALPGLRFVPHPAATIVRSPYAVVSLFKAGKAEGGMPERLDAPEDALVTRPRLDVEVRYLPEGAAALFEALRALPLGDAAAATLAEWPDLDIGAALGGFLAAGAFAAIA